MKRISFFLTTLAFVSMPLYAKSSWVPVVQSSDSIYSFSPDSVDFYEVDRAPYIRAYVKQEPLGTPVTDGYWATKNGFIHTYLFNCTEREAAKIETKIFNNQKLNKTVSYKPKFLEVKQYTWEEKLLTAACADFI